MFSSVTPIERSKPTDPKLENTMKKTVIDGTYLTKSALFCVNDDWYETYWYGQQARMLSRASWVRSFVG